MFALYLTVCFLSATPAHSICSEVMLPKRYGDLADCDREHETVVARWSADANSVGWGPFEIKSTRCGQYGGPTER